MVWQGGGHFAIGAGEIGLGTEPGYRCTAEQVEGRQNPCLNSDQRVPCSVDMVAKGLQAKAHKSGKQTAVADSVRKGRLSSQEEELVGCRGSDANND